MLFKDKLEGSGTMVKLGIELLSVVCEANTLPTMLSHQLPDTGFISAAP